jgi:hypothetical protein
MTESDKSATSARAMFAVMHGGVLALRASLAMNSAELIGPCIVGSCLACRLIASLMSGIISHLVFDIAREILDVPFLRTHLHAQLVSEIPVSDIKPRETEKREIRRNPISGFFFSEIGSGAYPPPPKGEEDRESEFFACPQYGCRNPRLGPPISGGLEMPVVTSGQSRGPPNDAIVGQRLRKIGFALIATCVACFGLLWGMAVLMGDRPFESQSERWLSMVGVLGLSMLPLIGVFLLYRSRQHLAKFHSAERLHDPRPPVVFLRAFQLDSSAKDVVFPLYLITFEERLAAALSPIGPLVALGQPEEALPPPGASRFQETQQTWKDRVVDLFKRARLVVLVFGTSPALLWETTTAFQMLKPQQLLILGVGRDTPREYEALSRIFKEATGRKLPALRSLRRAISRTALQTRSGITFGEGWMPRTLRLSAPFWRLFWGNIWSAAGVHYGLKPVFRANGIEWHPYPVSKLEVLGWMIFVSSCLLILVKLYYDFD